MWHEARKQEKLIRGMIVDYRRRAERRRDFYEKIKADPTQFLQLHGRQCKIHLDPAVAAAGEGPAIMMPWQGDHDNMIDRFDVRAHLDYIPEIITPDLSADDLSLEERNCNYERYRILAQNMFLGIGEEKFLHQLAVEERFGVTIEEKETQREKMSEKKGTGVAIGYNYDDNKHPVPESYPPSTSASASAVPAPGNGEKEDSDEESDVEIVDVDLAIDVNKVQTPQAHVMNTCGTNFGMQGTDLFSFLTGDAHDAEKQKQLIREEKEKALFSGRKSRRERRAHRDKRLALRVVSPPHYAARPPSPHPSFLEAAGEADGGRSPSPPPPSDRITFITSFGGDEEMQDTTEKIPVSKAPQEKSKVNTGPKDRSYASVLKEPPRKQAKRSNSRWSEYSPYKRSQRSGSPRRSLSPWSNESRSISGSRSKSRSRSISGSRSRSRSRSKSRSRSMSSSNSVSKSRLRSKSRSRSKSRERKRSFSGSSSRSRSRNRSPSSSSDSRKRSYRSSSSSSREPRRHTKSNTSTNRGHSASNPHSTSGGNSAPKVPRYYGRKREGARSSSSELSIDSSDSNSNATDKTKEKLTGGKTSQVLSVVRKSGAAPKHVKEKLSLKERLKKKMQAQLSRQLRADMKAEAERLEREQQLQQERDEEMREMAIKIRRRQREMRHQQQLSASSGDSDSSSPDHSTRSKRNKSPDEESDKDKAKQASPPPKVLEKKTKAFSSDEEKPSPPRKTSSKPRVPVWEYEMERDPKPRIPVWKHEERSTAPFRHDSEPEPHYSERNYRGDQEEQHYGGYRNEGRSYNRNDDGQNYNRQFNNNRNYNSRSQGDSRQSNFHNNRSRGYQGGRNWDSRNNYDGNRQRGYNEGNRRYYDNYQGEESHNRWSKDRDHGEGSSKGPTKKLVDY